MTIHSKTDIVSGSIFRENAAMQAAAKREANLRGRPMQIRSNRYDGCGRLVERACFYEGTVDPGAQLRAAAGTRKDPAAVSLGRRGGMAKVPKGFANATVRAKAIATNKAKREAARAALNPSAAPDTESPE